MGDCKPTPPPTKKADDKPKQPGATVCYSRSMNYEGQNKRALTWAAVYFLGWLLQRLWCHLGLPDHCDIATEPLEVLTDLVVLFTFSLAQVSSILAYVHSGRMLVSRRASQAAYWCEVLEESVFEGRMKAAWYFGVVFVTQLIISAMGLIDGLKPWDRTNPGEDFEFSSLRTTLYIFGLIFVVFIISWHFAYAYLNVPGMQLISGSIKDVKKPDVDLFGIYTSSRIVVVAWCILFTSFILAEDMGFMYQGALLAWVLSLIAAFPQPLSCLWLGITTGIFLQGIGANRLRFLGVSDV